MKTERNDKGINRKILVFLIILLILIAFSVWIYGWYNQTPFEFSNPSDVIVSVQGGGLLERFDLTETQRAKLLLYLEDLTVKRTLHEVRRVQTKITFSIIFIGNGVRNTPNQIVLNKEDLSESYAYDSNKKTWKFSKLQSEELLKIIIGFVNSNS